MAPRTYLRKQVPVSTTKSAMAINTLLAKNMAKKCHSNGLHTNNSMFFLEQSAHFNKSNDTFSRLASGENFNNVIFATSKAPYESFLSCSTVDIRSMLSGTNSKLGSINHSCKNDGCISRSLMLIESWDEQKIDFVTRRRKSTRKTVRNIVKAKTFTKVKPTRPCRISISPNVSNTSRTNVEVGDTGIRTSKRLKERVFNGFNNQDASISAILSNRTANCISPLVKTAEPQSNNQIGFDSHIIRRSRSRISEHSSSMRDEKQSASILEVSSHVRDTSVQDVSKSFLRYSKNNTRDNNDFLELKHSTPFIIREPSHKRLEELIGNSPRVTRQSSTKKQLQFNKTDNYNTDPDTSSNVPIKRRSRGRPTKTDVIAYDMPPLRDISEIPTDYSVRITRSKGLPKNETKLGVLLENSLKGNRIVSLKGFLHDNNSISSRTRSRSVGQIDATNLSIFITTDKLTKASIRVCKSEKLRSKSVGRPRKSVAKIVEYSTQELNKENLSDPFKRVTQRRKTTDRKYQRPSRNEIDNKSSTLRDIPACSMKNIYRMSPMLTRLQRKLILQSSANNISSNANLSNPKLENTPYITTPIRNCIIKQEPVENDLNTSLEYNYSIEDVSSPMYTSNDLPSDSVSIFKPKYQGTPKSNSFRNSTVNRSTEDTQENISAVSFTNDETPIERVDVSSVRDIIENNAQTTCSMVEQNVSSDSNVNLAQLCVGNIKLEHQFAVPTLRLARKMYAPGKGYRRSIVAAKETYREIEDANATKNSNHTEQRRSSVRLVPLTVHQRISGGENNAVFDEFSGTPTRLQRDQNSIDSYKRSLIESGSVNIDDRLEGILNESITEVEAQTARDIVLKNCGQETAEEWSAFYPDSLLRNCWKIGEGVYGEVFMFRNVKKTVSVIKVIPIEGDQVVNCEPQKKFQDILSEIIIAKKLSSVTSPGFNRLESVHLVRGAYPELLLEQWRLFDEANGSENDCPDTFQTSNQLYLILQLENGGKDLESYEFKNAVGAYSIFMQICHSLAQAEHRFSFEHRDLHWGNVLISACPMDTILTYTLPTTTPNNNNYSDHQYAAEEDEYTVATHGVQCNIIDFTLSRMTIPSEEEVVVDVNRHRSGEWPNDYVLYNDLSEDPELFNGEGDPQFDVYRQMKKETSDDWSQFCPKTNVYWLSYILQKMLTEVRYSQPNSRIHRSFLGKMRRCRSRIHLFSNCADVAKSLQ